MKSGMYLLGMLALILGWPCFVDAQATTAVSTAKPTATLTLDEKAKTLELEKLQLENEKLKLEMEKLKFQATQTQVISSPKSEEVRKQAIDVLQAEMLKKTEGIAKENKDKENLVILDLVDSEIWYKGVRYSIHQWFDMAEDNHWKMDKRVNQRYMDGDPQYLYRYKNISLLRYESQPRGKLVVTAPVRDGDFQILTPEGVTFDSSVGDVRNAFQSAYFSYENQAHEGKLTVLRYLHNKGFFAFSDRLEFAFDKEGKLVNIRYGVLDEH